MDCLPAGTYHLLSKTAPTQSDSIFLIRVNYLRRYSTAAETNACVFPVGREAEGLSSRAEGDSENKLVWFRAHLRSTEH